MRFTQSTAPGKRNGFSLVELMVVIGIITLLIGIALPAFSQAKMAAKVATTTATINAISTGLEQFRTDERLGGQYPPSTYFSSDSGHLQIVSPHNGAAVNRVGGASLVAWALAGADMLGTPGFRDLNANDPAGGTVLAGLAPWGDDVHPGSTGLYYLQGSRPYHPRSAFVDVSKMKFPKGEITRTTAVFRVPNSTDTLESICFLDSFDQPILYYRANPGRPNLVSDQSPTDDAKSSQTAGVYNLRDNYNIARLGDGMDLGPGKNHFLSADSNNKLGNVNGPVSSAPIPRRSFGWTLHNPQSTIYTPHNAETYVLLSAGPDGLFGTEDDVANFPTNK